MADQRSAAVVLSISGHIAPVVISGTTPIMDDRMLPLPTAGVVVVLTTDEADLVAQVVTRCLLERGDWPLIWHREVAGPVIPITDADLTEVAYLLDAPHAMAITPVASEHPDRDLAVTMTIADRPLIVEQRLLVGAAAISVEHLLKHRLIVVFNPDLAWMQSHRPVLVGAFVSRDTDERSGVMAPWMPSNLESLHYVEPKHCMPVDRVDVGGDLPDVSELRAVAKTRAAQDREERLRIASTRSTAVEAIARAVDLPVPVVSAAVGDKDHSPRSDLIPGAVAAQIMESFTDYDDIDAIAEAFGQPRSLVAHILRAVGAKQRRAWRRLVALRQAVS